MQDAHHEMKIYNLDGNYVQVTATPKPTRNTSNSCTPILLCTMMSSIFAVFFWLSQLVSVQLTLCHNLTRQRSGQVLLR